MARNPTAPKRTTDDTTESGANSKRARPTPTHFHTGNSSFNQTSSATNLPQVVINSTTYDAGYGPEMITRAEGPPIVLEPSLEGIVVGPSSIPFPWFTASPSGQKDVTVAGVPVTVETPSPTHSEKSADTTATNVNTTEPATKTSSSSNSTTTTSDSTRIPYVISAKWNAPPGKFQDFVKTLPEPGSHEDENGHTNHGEPFWNLYFTKLSRKEAAEVRQLDFIASALSGYETTFNYDFFSTSGSMENSLERSRNKRSNNPTPDQNLYTRHPLYSYQQLISQPTKDHPPGDNPYLFDPSLGDKSSIYILDSGCDRTHPELDIGERGNPDSVRGWPDNEWFHDWSGHGTKIASVAAGINLGVASKADIICVQAFLPINPPTPKQEQLFIARINEAFEWVRADIDDKKSWNSAVINHSSGVTLRTDKNGNVFPDDIAINNYYRDMLNWCDDRGVPFVVAAGNYGNALYDGLTVVGPPYSAHPPPPWAVPFTVDFYTPHLLYQHYKSMIIVGGVNNNGSLWPYTTPYNWRQRKPGYIDTYAQAGDVQVALAGTKNNGPDHGTSFSTAAVVGVSGLIAYFLSLDSIRQGWLIPSSLPHGQEPQQILDLRAIKSSLSQPAPFSLQRYAYERSNYPFVDFDPRNLNYYAIGGFPAVLPVVYNDAWRGWCERGRAIPPPPAPPHMVKRQANDQPVVINGHGFLGFLIIDSVCHIISPYEIYVVNVNNIIGSYDVRCYTILSAIVRAICPYPDEGNPGYCQCTDGLHFSFVKSTNPCPYTSPGPSSQLVSSTAEPMPSTMPDPTTSSSFSFTLDPSCSSHVPMQSQDPYAPVSDDCQKADGGSHSDIFTCGDNSTLFNLFAPGGTPHSNGQASTDIEGWETFGGGGCVCVNGAFCCNPGASTCLPIEQTNDDWGSGANELTWYAELQPACSCDG
ncbi:MAG: hypothetical protein Q9165_001276 [Trypethelium subeluteriae]